HGAPRAGLVLLLVDAAQPARYAATHGLRITVRTTPRTVGISSARNTGPLGLNDRSTTSVPSWYCFSTAVSCDSNQATTMSPCAGAAPHSTSTMLPSGMLSAAFGLTMLSPFTRNSPRCPFV